jgi:hypothetical protein
VGAERAARLRAGYGDLLQRIARRSRTPEDRDRLLERAHRLNPDDYTEEAPLREALSGCEAEWAALIAELPSRRRGRRGGKRRVDGGGTGAPGPAGEAGASDSSRMEDESNGGDEGTDDADVDRADWDAGVADRDDDGAAESTDVPGDG